jgi:hypothetical protein
LSQKAQVPSDCGAPTFDRCSHPSESYSFAIGSTVAKRNPLASGAGPFIAPINACWCGDAWRQASLLIFRCGTTRQKHGVWHREQAVRAVARGLARLPFRQHEVPSVITLMLYRHASDDVELAVKGATSNIWVGPSETCQVVKAFGWNEADFFMNYPTQGTFHCPRDDRQTSRSCRGKRCRQPLSRCSRRNRPRISMMWAAATSRCSDVVMVSLMHLP